MGTSTDAVDRVADDYDRVDPLVVPYQTTLWTARRLVRS